MSDTGQTIALLGAGLSLFGVGVAGLSAMARRSVSLRALRAIAADSDPRGSFEADVGGRLVDLERHGLARQRGGRMVMTPRGRRVLRASRLLRRLAGVRP